ncbi:hypothetical protein ABT061_07515 [Streptosporangium sp. NPDC002544]|uniref:hypothetical protein n=1 Tax=Streptosporangium sp. NPDC002544 TaxID=3154538 RepID=UPI0033245A20
MRLRTHHALAALLLALTVTGCGAAPETGTVASADGGAKQAGGSAAPTLSQEEKGVRFAQCMRENGVPMEDPEGGRIQLKFDKNSGVDRATVDKAMQACQEFNPQGDRSRAADPKAEERGRAYAACMRENGLESFPDPKPGQRGIMITPEIGEDPDFPAAQQKCQDIMTAGGPQ